MSTYKNFLASDIIITPFEVNKGFYFEGTSALTGSNGGVDRLLGFKPTASLFNPNIDFTTGEVGSEYARLVYHSIKNLYYSNNLHLSASNGDSYTTSGSYWNYPQTDLYYRKYFPTATSTFSYPNGKIGVVSIPSKLYGNRIQPTTFYMETGGVSITDDGEGNIINSSNQICGNIIYNQGMVIITSTGNPSGDGSEKLGDLYGTGSYGTASYGDPDTNFVVNFINSTDITCSFSSSFEIFETQYKCTIRANEFNYSLNPSLLSSSVKGQNKILDSGSAQYSNFVTGSSFSPFVTTIGLYNDNQELIAVGKLAQPLPTSQTTDTTIFINIDK